MTSVKEQLRVGKRTLSVSNLQKVLYPDAGFTKGQVLDYYARIAPTLVPHLKDRALTLKRYPDGVDGGFFFEKNCPSHRPDWVKTTGVKTTTKTVNFCVVDDAAALIWVANLASLELHTLLSRKVDVTRPTMMVFDLDPGAPAGILECIEVAQVVRETFEHLGLQCLVKTSGSKGLHLAVPLNTAVDFEQTKSFAQAIAMLMERQLPNLALSSMSKAAREGKVFVDWSQNDQHKTTCCAYSLRARPQPTVSTPVTWDELANAKKKRKPELLTFVTGDVLARVARHGDLFADVLTLKQKLPKLKIEQEISPPRRRRSARAAVTA